MYVDSRQGQLPEPARHPGSSLLALVRAKSRVASLSMLCAALRLFMNA